MSAALVRVLYRSLLLSSQQLESDVIAGRTLYNALRSGAVDPYDGAKGDWYRERRYENRFQDAKAIVRLTQRPMPTSVLVRTQFDKPLDSDNRLEVHRRIDFAFEALHEIDDQNALIRDLAAQGIFAPKHRSDRIQFRIGDVVDVGESRRGVIVGWSEEKAHAYGELHVTYEVLVDLSQGGDRAKLMREPQKNLRLTANPKAIENPSVIIHFDGFANGRHIPCAALTARYPDDVDPTDTSLILANHSPPQTPSIIDLQFADEEKLVRYLQCDDSTVIQFATAALEGRWIGECGDDVQRRVRDALRQMDEGQLALAIETLSRVVEEYPNYAYGWSKLGTAQLQAGNIVAALNQYERAVKLKPQMLDALAGLGTCATRLKRWDIAHRAAVALLRVHPENDSARLLLNNAIASQIF